MEFFVFPQSLDTSEDENGGVKEKEENGPWALLIQLVYQAVKRMKIKIHPFRGCTKKWFSWFIYKTLKVGKKYEYAVIPFKKLLHNVLVYELKTKKLSAAISIC
jgi:hypothetical protein